MTLQARASSNGDLAEQSITDSYLVDAALETLPVQRSKQTHHFLQNIDRVENSEHGLDNGYYNIRRRKRRSVFKTAKALARLIKRVDPKDVNNLARLRGQQALQNILKNAEESPVKGKPKGKKRYRKHIVKQYTKPGNYYEAFQDYLRMEPHSLKMIKSGKVRGYTGRVGNMQVTFRNSSKSYPNSPTIEIFDASSKQLESTIYKIRYTGKGNQRHE